MMKEAALFTVSTGVLIYFIAPVSEKEQATPEKVERVEAAPAQSVSDADDEWGYGDEDDSDEEEFMFDQPLSADDDDAYAENEEDADEQEAVADQQESGTIEVAQNKNQRRAHPDSPQGSERGSRENPVVFKTDNPSDPADD